MNEKTKCEVAIVTVALNGKTITIPVPAFTRPKLELLDKVWMLWERYDDESDESMSLGDFAFYLLAEAALEMKEL